MWLSSLDPSPWESKAGNLQDTVRKKRERERGEEGRTGGRNKEKLTAL